MKNNELREEWADMFREYFDRTLRPKKPTMKNLDREIIVDFVRKQRIEARNSIKAELVKRLDDIPEASMKEAHNSSVISREEAIELVKKI